MQFEHTSLRRGMKFKQTLVRRSMQFGQNPLRPGMQFGCILNFRPGILGSLVV
jgi:hypothetical protein